MKPSEALVARADVIAAARLQVTEKMANPLRCKVLHGDSGQWPTTFRRDEGKEQPERIAIASSRMRAQTLLSLRRHPRSLVHNAYRFAFEGPSMRKSEADMDAAATTIEPTAQAKLAKGAKK